MNRLLLRALIGLLALAALAVLAVWSGLTAAGWYYGAQLPKIGNLSAAQLGAPLRVYSADGKLIGQFGIERREILSYQQFPPQLVKAFLAAEDADFFHHAAIDWPGLMRAGWVLLTTGQKKQGGSTITMQLARDLFLTPEKTYGRKIKEILLAREIERRLDKKQILTLYLNRVFLGNRAYGAAAAAQVYYGKNLAQLSLAQMATLAGLPKAPSRDNPIASPAHAESRRDYVLTRMRELGWITSRQYQDARDEPVEARLHGPPVDVPAPYAAEMVRAQMVARYGEAAYSAGYRVTTTLDSKDQAAAQAALRAGLLAYAQRHGYSGAEDHLPPKLLQRLRHDPRDAEVMDFLDQRDVIGGLIPAVLVEFSSTRLKLETLHGAVELPAAAFAWAHLSARNRLQAGDIVRLEPTGGDYKLAAVPRVQGALVALDPDDGAIRALVGGFDFYANSYNRAVQAQRQMGSGFKPFLYSAALAAGYTPASVFLDAPIVLSPAEGSLDTWRPENDDDKFSGPMRLREALVHSVNLVSIRVARALGVQTARDYIAPRFGIPESRIPDNLTMALGTAALTPLEAARGYAVFANGGFLVTPYFIRQIEDAHGQVVYRADPPTACPRCDDPAPASGGSAAAPPIVAASDGHAPRTLDAVTDYLITSMMHDVVVRGTGAAAAALGRRDLAGKTGTTNNQTDAWFNGFNPGLVTSVWVGFDQPQGLGAGEYGARAALPIWIAFMQQALAGAPERELPRPDDVVTIEIDPRNGKRVNSDFPGAIAEVVQKDHLPPPDDVQAKDAVQVLY
ncbi:MAG: PBP1A family penicillin-binding protein [Gammaproteobacteria bacterium]|nr:PBP1A family penicillin-binding protein [Gammaproteobacteria bacterium]